MATWVVKTALVPGSKFKPSLPEAFYRSMYAEQTPSTTTRVWLAATPYTEHHQSDFRPIRVHPDDQPPPAGANAYSAMIVVGQFVGFVVSWIERVPPLERVTEQFGPALVSIWPNGAGEVTWPPKAGRLNFDHLDALADTVVAIEDVTTARGRPIR